MNKVMAPIVWILMLPINLIRNLLKLLLWIILIPFRLIDALFTFPFWLFRWLFSFLSRGETLRGEIIRIWQDPPPGAVGRHWTYVLFDTSEKKVQVRLHYFQAVSFLRKYGEGDVGQLKHRGQWLVKWSPTTDVDDLIAHKDGIYGSRAFLSYRHEVKPDARYVYSFLIERGVDVQMDEHDIEPGDSLDERIIMLIENSDYFIPVLSKNYFRSSWCREEFELAANLGIRIIPIRATQNDIYMPPAIQRLYHEQLGDPLYIDLNESKVRERLAILADRLLAGDGE